MSRLEYKEVNMVDAHRIDYDTKHQQGTYVSSLISGLSLLAILDADSRIPYGAAKPKPEKYLSHQTDPACLSFKLSLNHLALHDNLNLQ